VPRNAVSAVPVKGQVAWPESHPGAYSSQA
jgi:hypothetical protein